MRTLFILIAITAFASANYYNTMNSDGSFSTTYISGGVANTMNSDGSFSVTYY